MALSFKGVSLINPSWTYARCDLDRCHRQWDYASNIHPAAVALRETHRARGENATWEFKQREKELISPQGSVYRRRPTKQKRAAGDNLLGAANTPSACPRAAWSLPATARTISNRLWPPRNKFYSFKTDTRQRLCCGHYKGQTARSPQKRSHKLSEDS